MHKPGSLNISGRWYLLQAISAAGGLTENAGKKIYVLRKADNGLSDTLEVDTDELFHNANSDVEHADRSRGRRQRRSPADDPHLLHRRAEGARRARIQQRRPHHAPFRDRAGPAGPTDRASSKVRIKRRGPDGKDTEIVVDYKRILSGKDRDPILEPNDVVVVKESFF